MLYHVLQIKTTSAVLKTRLQAETRFKSAWNVMSLCSCLFVKQKIFYIRAGLGRPRNVVSYATLHL